MGILDQKYIIEMANGERWSVPVRVIAHNRAKHYASEFGGDEERSLLEDTIPLFEDDNYAIEDWAKNNMNWSDVEPFALLHSSGNTDYEIGWTNGAVEIIDQ